MFDILTAGAAHLVLEVEKARYCRGQMTTTRATTTQPTLLVSSLPTF